MTNKSATSQDLPMRFWGLLGPFLTLLILAIYLFKVPHASPFMPLLAGAGLVLCSGWRIKGLAGALLLTALFLTWSYPQVPLQEKFWFVGISIAFGLAFVVTTLSLEEVDASILKLSSDATKGWSQLKNLDQKREQEQTLWLKNREKLEVDLEWTKAQLDEVREEGAKLKASLAHSEEEKKRALEEIASARSVCKSLEGERDALMSQAKAQSSKVEELSQALQKQKHAFEEEVHKLKNQCAQSKELCDRASRENQRLHEQVQTLSTKLHAKSQTSDQVEMLQARIAELEAGVPKDAFEPLYRQLRAQFDDKCRTLDETRRDLFWAQEKLTVLERELDEVTLYAEDESGSRLTRELSDWLEELSLEQEVAAMEREVASALLNN